MAAKARRSPTGPILVRIGLALGAIYLVLVAATRRPGFALAVELASVVVLWALYVVRFAFDTPRALLPEMFVFRVIDRIHPPPRDSVVFTGSSTIAHWTSLATDMAPVAVTRRGISGARLNQIAALMPTLLAGYGPRAVVLYAGENDLAGFLGSKSASPAAVLDSFNAFCREVHRRLPTTPIYFLSIKPAKTRRAHARAFEEANRLIAEVCAGDARLYFIDITTPLLERDGTVRSDVYEADGIHLNGEGYAILAEVVRKHLH